MKLNEIRDGSKIIGYPGRDYLQRGEYFFSKKLEGQRDLFFREKKGDENLFFDKNEGVRPFFN